MKRIKVRITGFWQDDDKMLRMVKRYAFGSTCWKNIEFSSGKFDKLIILTRPYSHELKYVKRDAITFRTEPLVSSNNHTHETSFVVPLSLPLWSWTKEQNYKAITQISNIEKNQTLSSVTSDLYYLEGHKARLEFIYTFDRLVEEGFDLFGRNRSGKFFQMLHSYRGELSDKFDGLIHYQYHFNCENSFYTNYFTEKIVDPILAECLCFYDGCPNISSFIDDRAFVKININNIEESVHKIIAEIEANGFEKRIHFIREQKRRLLTHLNPLNIIWMVINEYDLIKECLL